MSDTQREADRPGREQVVRWLGNMLETTTDYAVVLVSPARNILAWEGASERLFGYSADEVLGQSFSMLFTEDDLKGELDRQEIALALQSGRSEDDRWHVRKDGSQFWSSGVLQSLPNADGTVECLCKVVRDKTDVRTQLQTLYDQVEHREQELALRNKTLASLAHELRNPMGPISSAVALLQRSRDAEMQKSALGVLERQVNVLSQLLDELNGVTGALLRPPTKLNIEPVIIQDALGKVMDAQLPRAQQRSQELRLTVPDVPICIEADALRLDQMLSNLIDNALKYTPPKGHINVSASVEAEMVIIRVEDDGIGISAEVLPHIFELFTREGSAPDVPGLGVGLSVVKHFAALHGGNVEARSPGEGKGSTFGLRLPLRQGVASSAEMGHPGAQ
jgi:PAS domain S-box-containing protein